MSTLVCVVLAASIVSACAIAIGDRSNATLRVDHTSVAASGAIIP